jgi:hypothetical protein
MLRHLKQRMVLTMGKAHCYQCCMDRNEEMLGGLLVHCQFAGMDELYHACAAVVCIQILFFCGYPKGVVACVVLLHSSALIKYVLH